MIIGFYAPLKSPGHPVPSGDRRMAQLLIKILEKSGHEVTQLSSLRSWEGKGDEQKQHQIRHQATAELTRIRKSGLAARLDLVFVYHLYHKAPDWIGIELCHEQVIPYVLVEASYAPKQAGGPWHSGHVQAKKCIGRANAIISVNPIDSHCVREIARSDCHIGHIMPFLEAVEENSKSKFELRERLCSQNNLDQQCVWLIAVAMMREGDKMSSYRMLASSVSKIASRNWQLVVIGDGECRTQVAEMLEKVAAQCLFTGKLSPGAVADWLDACDVYVWPSVNEAYGLGLLEAVAHGLPTIACSYGGVGQIVEHGFNGFLVNPGDCASYTERLDALVSNPEARTRFGENAIQKFLHDHTLEKAKIQVVAVLEEASGSNKQRSR